MFFSSTFLNTRFVIDRMKSLGIDVQKEKQNEKLVGDRKGQMEGLNID